MLRVVVLISGGGTNLQAIIDGIKENKITNAEIVGVISNKKDAYGLERANINGITSKCVNIKDFTSRDDFNQELMATIDSFEPDLIVLAGFLVILPPELVRNYKGRIINVHPSLIPSFCGEGYYGLKVHEAVLKRGNKVTGATVHFVDEGTDTGPILLQKAVSVQNDDTPEALQKRVMEEAEWKILPYAIDCIANGRVSIKDNIAFIKE